LPDDEGYYPLATPDVDMSRILLVEDDTDLRLLLEHVLLGAGYEVDVAATVAESYARLDRASYDLVLADGRLEDGTGMMVAQLASQTGAKALIITGYAFELPREQLARYDFLLKPVRPGELLDAIERVLQQATL
jgi:DNA-binding NtrC family response regulator